MSAGEEELREEGKQGGENQKVDAELSGDVDGEEIEDDDAKYLEGL